MVEYALIGAMVLVGLIAGAKLLTAAQGGVYSRHQKALGDWRSP